MFLRFLVGADFVENLRVCFFCLPDDIITVLRELFGQQAPLRSFNGANVLNIRPIFEMIPFSWLQILLSSPIHGNIKQMPSAMYPGMGLSEFLLDRKLYQSSVLDRRTAFSIPTEMQNNTISFFEFTDVEVGSVFRGDGAFIGRLAATLWVENGFV